MEIGAELYAVGELDALGTPRRGDARGVPVRPAGPGARGAGRSRFCRAARERRRRRRRRRRRVLRARSAAHARALGFFFRAASGVPEAPGDASARGRATTTTTSDAERDPLLGHLVELLRSIMSGFPAASKRGDAMDDDADDEDENASSLTRLEYYETLMLFFERLGGHAAAAECAHAALREVSAAFGSSDALDDDDADSEPPNARDAETLVAKKKESASSSAIRRRRASRLWANLLQYALDLGKWRDAYAATLSVPGAESRRNALRRLVAAACDPNDPNARLGGGAALASAPLSGDRLDAVADALETRAAAALSSFGFSPAFGRGGSRSAGFSKTLREVLVEVDDVTRANSPGRVLYALRVARGEMREAARAARAEASRLGRVADSAGAAARDARARRFRFRRRAT